MNLRALQHLIRAAQALSEQSQLIVLGSASLLASFPELGNPNGILTSTYDADIFAEPFEELTSLMLEEALGEGRAFYQLHGYHADVLRDAILQTLPDGWRERLVPVAVTTAKALEPHDIAAVKILVHRPKDVELVKHLIAMKCIHPETLRERIALLPVPIEMRSRLQTRLHAMLSTQPRNLDQS